LQVVPVRLESFKTEKEADMSVNVQIEETPDYLIAKATGTGSVDEAEGHFESLADECNRTNKNKLLLDFTGVSADVPLAVIYALGELSRVFRQYKCKVASICRPENHNPNCFFETVAQNRWVDLRVFTNIEDAKEWLLKE
jgi:hypothetical protein